MFKNLWCKLSTKFRAHNQIRETSIHPSIYRVFELWQDPVTTCVAVPFTPARGSEKVIDYILRGIAFKDQHSKDAVVQAITDLILKSSPEGKITIPMGDYEYVIVLKIERHPLW